ncbi:MAG TPA: TonB-dependent receptor [Bryobacteraceae bacterium]|nr:TonB-dependent receptor [Bryobacteraceae bacterium]
MSRLRHAIGNIFLLFCSCGVLPRANAQMFWGGLQGEVTDISGAPIPGASVGVSSPAHPRATSTTTDTFGRYTFPVLPVGSYSVHVSAPGFRPLRYAHVELRTGVQMTFNARLPLGSITETVEVRSAVDPLDGSSSRTATVIDTAAMANLSHGRSFHSLLGMAPGVRHESRAGAVGVGGITVDGASGSENAWYVDGVEVTDAITGALRQQYSMPTEFLKAVQVQSGGFEAEYGGATGGVVTATTRGGTNELHGELQLSIMPGSLNASDRGSWQRSATDPSRAEYLRPSKDNYRILYPGFSLGGPLLRNRVFGYLSYMPEAERTIRQVPYATGARVFEQDRMRQYTLTRLDASPVSAVQLSASWVWSPSAVRGGLPLRDTRIQAPRTVDTAYERVPAQAVSVSGTWTGAGATVLTGRYGYKYTNGRAGNSTLPDVPWYFYRTPSWAAGDVPLRVTGPAGLQSTSGAYTLERDVVARHSFYLDGSRVFAAGGRQHVFKAGFASTRTFNDVSDRYANGRFDIYWGDSLSRGSITGARGRYGYYIWEDGPRLDSHATGQSIAAYVQDSWKALPGLTINAGVRLEREYLPPYSRAGETRSALRNPVDFGWGDKVAPRLGAAWDLRGDGRWKLSGSYGLFYDAMKYMMARMAFGGMQWWSHAYRLDSTALAGLDVSRSNALGEPIASWNNLAMPVNARGEWQGIDPDLKPFTSREMTVALDRRITSRLQASVRYTNKDLLRTIEDIGILDPNENESYLIGNPGFGLTRNGASPYGGKTPDGREYLVPRAIRRYDALEFRIQGSVSGTHLIGSYTLSRLYGNFAGLANSDEAGRMDPSLSRSFDLPTYYFDASGSQRNVEGRLATDRPHVFKLFGWREMRNRAGTTSVGFTQIAMSGTLDSTTVYYLTAPTFPRGRGDLGRTPVNSQTDLKLGHTLRTGERMQVRLEGTASNLLNQGAVVARVTQINRVGAITSTMLPADKFFAGYELNSFVRPGEGSPVPYNPIYGMPGADVADGGLIKSGMRNDPSSAFLAQNPAFGAFQGPRTFRFGLRLTF